MKRLLILGGTAEARQLAAKVARLPGLESQVSLAGRTADPEAHEIPVRIGGFGGTQGLAQYLLSQQIDLLIDATHPFANQMSANAAVAADQTNTPRMCIQRPLWQRETPEEWIEVADIASAVDALPAGARAFTATGRGSMDDFLRRDDIYTCLRVIDPSDDPYPGQGEFVVARPPFSVKAEEKVLKHHRATHLVVKNSGGGPGRTKLTAAGQLGLPIVIVERMPLPKGSQIVEDADAALHWVKNQIG